MNNWQLTFFNLAIASLLICYTNCSGFSPSDGSKLSDNFSRGPASVLGADGSLTAYQDKRFEFSLANLALAVSKGNTSITYSVVGILPTWLSLNPSTGILSGIPQGMGTSPPFTIQVNQTGQSAVLGPFFTRTFGNPLKEFQWHLQNSGQTTFAYQAGAAGNDIHLANTIASDITGRGVRIAISDTGIFQNHPGLSPNILASNARNYLNDYRATGSWSGDSTPALNGKNELAHGTAATGIIAEKGWTNFGGRGVAPDAQIAGFLFLQAQDTLVSRGLFTSGYLDQYQGSFDIFNYSWGESQCSFSKSTAGFAEKLRYGTQSLRSGKGALYIRSAGNEYLGDLADCYDLQKNTAYFLGNSNFAEENTSPFEILVAAMSARGGVASYSSPGSNIWISAPGGEGGSDSQTASSDSEPAILSSDAPGCGIGLKASRINAFEKGGAANTDCFHTSTMNGTSAAAPVVTGAIALILEANPNLTWRDIKHILASTADLVAPGATQPNHPLNQNLAGHNYEQGWVTNRAGFHFQNWYGFGRLNVDAAVAMAKNYQVNLGPLKETLSGSSWKYNSGVINQSIPDNSSAGAVSIMGVSEAYTIEAVQIELTITNCAGEMGAELTSPQGTKSILLNINSGLRDTSINQQLLLSNAFYGESSSGNWTLKIIDAKAGCQAALSNWKINILGH